MNTITVPISLIEEHFKIKVKKNITSLGLDTASKCGWAIVQTTNNDAIINVGYIEIKTTDRVQKFIAFIKEFLILIKKDYRVIIEDTFLKKYQVRIKGKWIWMANVKMFSLLCRIGMIAFVISYLNGAFPEFIAPTSARANLKLKGNASKEDLVRVVNGIIGTNLTNNDEIDALILAFCGLKEVATAVEEIQQIS